jgi:uncharacterized membrane protein
MPADSMRHRRFGAVAVLLLMFSSAIAWAQPSGDAGGSAVALWGRIALLGIVTGLRSMLPLALLAWLAPFGWLASIWVRIVLGLAAVGELISDKLPKTPSRLSPGPLVGRLVLGGLVGGLLAGQAHAQVWLGAGLGAVGALGGSFGGNKLRGFLGRATGKPDLNFALLEDAIAISLGAWAILGSP